MGEQKEEIIIKPSVEFLVEIWDVRVLIFSGNEEYLFNVCAQEDIYFNNDNTLEENISKISMWVSTATGGYIIMLVNEDNKKPKKHIVHESVHIATEILDYINLPFTLENNEALAYTTAYVWDKINETIVI